MKTFPLIAICLTTYVCNAQVVEYFNDGDFTGDPVWSGSTGQFIINASQQLQLNNTIAGTSYLSTPFSSSSLDGFEWEVYVKQTFAPSASNFGRVYLVSNSDNLAGPLNGYYLQMGEAGSADAVELFRQSGTSHVSICRAANGMIASAFSIRVRVNRNVEALWTLSIDYNGGSAFAEAAHGTDGSFTNTSYAGVLCTYTAGNATKFFFDDFLAGPPLGDVTPPELIAAEVEGDSSLLLRFSEPLDTSKGTFIGSDELGTPSSLEYAEDLISAKLSFSGAFLNGKLYHLTMDSIADLAGNAMASASISFRHFVPSPAVTGDIVFNELFPDPSPSVGLPPHEFLELYNRSEKAFHLEGWTIYDATSTTTLPSRYVLPGEYLIITTTAGAPFYSGYGTTLGLPDMPTLNNSSDSFAMKDSSGVFIDSVHYTSSWYGDDDRALGGYTLERLQPSAPTQEPLNWTASEATGGGTPARANSVLGRKLDSKPPLIDSLIVSTNHQVIVYFNEAMDSASLTSGAYQLESLENPLNVVAWERSVTLVFASTFPNGQVSLLSIEGVMDTAQNVIPLSQMSFRYFVSGQPSPGVILINEIMADPSPVVHLPEAEYVEIVNYSNEPYDLQGWSLCDATSCAVLPHRIILPDDLLVLTSTTNAFKFDAVKVLPVVSFPSLNNFGEALSLRSPDGQRIDSMHYEIAWLGDDAKRDGGWSLERLLMAFHSTSELNWRPARDSSGGTPGRPNSILGDKLDATPPSIDSLVVLGPHELRVHFNEAIDTACLSDPQLFVVETPGEPASIVATTERSVTLMFHTQFINGYQNQLRIDSVADVAGNKMGPVELPFRYFIPGTPGNGDVLFNEIMSDPAPIVYLPEAEFVELFNNSNEPFDLQGWMLSDASTVSVLPSAILLPGVFMVLTSSTNATKFTSASNVIAVPAFPSLNNAGEQLVLRTREGILIDSLHYYAGWLGDGEKRDGGWSLERLLYDFASMSPMNWRPAIDTSGGTPGRPNSILGEPLDPVAPHIDSIVVKGDHRVSLYFSESMDSLSLAQVEYYFSETSGESPIIATVADTEVTLTFASRFMNGVQNFLSIGGLRDKAGNEISPARIPFMYFVPVSARPGVILINEIMADPSPVVSLPEAEFIEVFNHSGDPYDIGGWTLTDGTGISVLPSSMLLPGEFVILTSSASATKFDSAVAVVGVSNFPSLSNLGEPLVLRDREGTKIDSVRYESGWLGEGEKRDGGWSLERLLYDYASVSWMNWRPAQDSSGGTPGRPNSVLGERLDPISPEIDSLVILDANLVRLYFNESMDSISLSRTSSYYSEASGEYPTTVLVADSAVTLTFAQPFVNGVQNFLKVDQVSDKADNEVLPVRIPFMYFVPVPAQPGVILINEIMADPSPVVHLPEAEFIEIFNHSSDPYDLGGWTLADATGSSVLPSAILLPEEFMILTASSSAAKFDSTIRVVGVSNFPSLSNLGEPLVLRDRNGSVIDSLRYDAGWLGKDEKRDGGWSLERLLHDYASTSSMNWRPAVDSSGGTPGRPNSIVGERLDPTPPLIISLTVVDGNHLRIYFNESMDSISLAQLDSYYLEPSGDHPVTMHVADSAVTLTFALPFTNGQQQVLTIERLRDKADNEILPARMPFRYFVPVAAKAGVIVINEIMADPSPVVHLPEAEFIEVFNQSDSPYDLSGWTLTDGAGTTALPIAFLLPREFAVLTASSSATKFDSTIRVVGVSNFPSLSNIGEPLVLRDRDGVTIDSVRYESGWLGEGEKRDGGWSLERLLYDYASISSMNWRSAVDSSGGTPGRPNSILGEKLDPIPPRIDSLAVLDDRRVRLYFSEPMDSTSLTLPDSYFNETVQEYSLTTTVSDSSVTLSFDRRFTNGVECILAIDRVRDQSGNQIPLTRIPFMYFVPVAPKPGVVVINEIMADPSPVVRLPEAEFIEIFNSSSEPYDLRGWRLSDGADTTVLTPTIITPGQFVVLTASSNASKFDPAVRTLGVTRFPSLSNSGEVLVLRDPSGLVIDSVRYQAGWLDDEVKRDGGWSLERVLYEYSSSSPMNWRPSVDSVGGTPGKLNSVFGQRLDIAPPAIDSLVVVNSRELRLYFNEQMYTPSLMQRGAYAVDPINENPAAVKASGNIAELTFAHSFGNGDQYRLLVNSLTDSSGNLMPPVHIDFMYFRSGTPTKGVILFNEIMADPTPVVQLPEAEFIELLHRGTEPYDLDGWVLADANSEVALPRFIIQPGDHVTLTTIANAAKFSGKTLGISSFPSLSNSGELLILRNPAGLAVDSVRYDISWYGLDSKRDGGWSLERLSPDVPSDVAANWRPAIDSLGGTPGRLNSITGQKLDGVEPVIDSIIVIDDHRVSIYFNEVMDTASLVNTASYKIEETGQFPDGIEANSQSVTLSFGNFFGNGNSLHLAVHNVADLSGNSLSPTSVLFRYFDPGTVSPGVILINEIMADPAPVVHLPEAEYIEIVNRGAKPLDLKGWRLSDASTETLLPSAIILPQELLILTSTANQSKFEKKALGVAGFPSLNNAGESLVLRDTEGIMVDSLTYSIDWFGVDPKRDGGWSLERLRYELRSDWELNWRPSLDSMGGTPGLPNSRLGQHPDHEPPRLVGAWVEDANHITVSFSERIADPSSLSNFSVDSMSCVGFERLDPTKIRAAFDVLFENGQALHLKLHDIADTATNRMPDVEISLRYFIPKPVASRDIIITEIMADPAPTVGLPEAEYIELMNRSLNPVSLEGWNLIDGQGTVILPEAIIQPGEQVVLTSPGSSATFASGLRTIGIKGFPSLSNEGELLMLRDAMSSLIDSLFYDEDWYRSDGKSDGGWSLELIDSDNPCAGADNWAASDASAGGTPGEVNSINANKPDVTGPQLTGAELLSNSILHLTFNERLDKSFAQVVVDLSPVAGSYTMRFVDPAWKVVEVIFEETLRASTEYSLTVEGIFDCNGNRIDGEHASLRFAVPEAAHRGDIVINEILFNPHPNGVDFVEIYNQSPRYIDFSGWRFMQGGNDVNIDNAGIVPPLSYRVFTTDPQTLGSHYPQINSASAVATGLPSMPDDTGALFLMDADDQRVDSVHYEVSMHTPMLRDPEGVSLERISVSSGSSDVSNWRSANESAGFATPGFINSNSRTLAEDDEQEITVSPEVISMYSTGGFTLISYNLVTAGNFVTCRIVDQQGRVIRELAQNVSVGSQGFFRWDADDGFGQRVGPGYYAVYFEYFNDQGQVRLSRNRVIVAPR